MPPPRPKFTETDARKPSNSPSHVGKRHVRFRLPDAPVDTVIYLDPVPQEERDVMITFKSKRFRDLYMEYLKRELLDVEASAKAGAIATSYNRSATADPFQAVLSSSLAEPPSPQDSVLATDNKSLSQYKEDVGAAETTRVDHAAYLVAGQQQDFISPQLGEAASNRCLLWQTDNGPEAAAETTEAREWLTRGHEPAMKIRKGRCLETDGDELPATPPAVHVTTARDSYGHHAHAYRPRHEAYEADSEREFDRYADCIMTDSSARSAIGIPIDLDLDPNDPFASLFVISDNDSDYNNGDEENALRPFVMDKKNIVLDSACPEIAPHIVISPPSDPWEGCWAYSWNSPLPQYDGFLRVSSSWNNVPSYTPSYAEIEEFSCYELEPSASSTSHSPLLPASPVSALPRIVVSDVSQPPADAETMPSSSYRRLYKIAAITASVTATTFRDRWNSEDFCTNFDIPFEWSDPAAPFLIFYGMCRDTRIFDSLNPLLAPHIIVHEVPDEHPWDACQNRVPFPQQCGLLAVPGVACTCNSTPLATPIVIPSSSAPVKNECEDEDEADELFSEEEEEYETDSDSDLDVTSHLAGGADTETEPETDCECLDTPQDGVFAFAPTPPSPPSKLRESFVLGDDDDDDEDGPPPFDDWYQDIARRST